MLCTHTHTGKQLAVSRQEADNSEGQGGMVLGAEVRWHGPHDWGFQPGIVGFRPTEIAIKPMG